MTRIYLDVGPEGFHRLPDGIGVAVSMLTLPHMEAPVTETVRPVGFNDSDFIVINYKIET